MTQQETDYYEEVKRLLEVQGSDTEPSRSIVIEYMKEGLSTTETVDKIIND